MVSKKDTQKSIINNRSEILFLYDCTDANPNGDPLDENRPRIDEETELNLVTDVRLKRTIRDYLMNYKNENIFIKDQRDNEDNLYDAKKTSSYYSPVYDEDKGKDHIFKSVSNYKTLFKSNILNKCIDVRLFGATIPLDESKFKVKDKSKEKSGSGSITLTGPVQFRMGRSLHKVDLKFIKGNGAFASGKNKSQKTYREEYILPYSLINFYGVINEKAGNNTNLSEEDIKLLFDGMWNGTKNLISRSKFGQMPRLLLQIEYNDCFFIGDLNHKISLSEDIKNEKGLRNIKECKLDMSELIKSLKENKSNISKINYKFDKEIRVKGCENTEKLIEKFKSILGGDKVKPIEF